MKLKVFVITGEPSGDLHASRIVKELYLNDPSIEITGWGGDHLVSAGMNVLTHINTLSMMGFSDVVRKLPQLRKNIHECKSQIRHFNPDVLLLVDFSGFNLRIARWAKHNGYKVHYYIAPKTWAWRSGRNREIKKYVDQLYCIFPFEEEYFKNKGINAHYAGNPTNQITTRHQPDNETSIGILPGSRRQEISKVLPHFKTIIEQHDNVQWVISKMPHITKSEYQSLLSINNVTLTEESTEQLLSRVTAAFVTSGTATLEAAVIGCPHAVVYHTSLINYYLGRAFIRTQYISLPNIIFNSSGSEGQIVKEIIQGELNDESLNNALAEFSNEKKMNQMGANFKTIRSLLGDKKPELIVAQHILDHNK